MNPLPIAQISIVQRLVFSLHLLVLSLLSLAV
jgi:hypothetical protein